MAKLVEVGSDVIEFPDEMDDSAIAEVLKKSYASKGAAKGGPPPAPGPVAEMASGGGSMRPMGAMETPLIPEALLGPMRSGLPKVASALERVTPLAIGEASPSILAAALALATGGAGAIPAIAGAALGGMGGVGGRRAAQALAGVPITEQSPLARAAIPEGIPSSVGGDVQEILGSGAKEALFEGGGQALRKMFHVPKVPDEVTKLAEELGVPMAPKSLTEKIARKTIAGRQVASNAADVAERRATGRVMEAASDLGVAAPTPGIKPGEQIAQVRSAYEAAQKAAADARKAAAAAHRQEVQEGVQRGMTEAQSEVQILLNKIAPGELTPLQAGTSAQRGAREGIGIGKAEANRLYEASDLVNRGRPIPLAGHIEELKALADEMNLSPTPDPGAIVTYAKKLSEYASGPIQAKIIKASSLPAAEVPAAIQKVLTESAEDLKNLVLPYEQARELQKWLGERMSGKLSDKLSRGRLKHMWGSLTTSIEDAVAGTPGAAALGEANLFYREYADVAKRGAAARLVDGLKSSPDDVLKLMAQGESRIIPLRKAVLGFAEEYGTQEEKAAAAAAWDDLGRTYAQERLLRGGVEKLPQNLAKERGKALEALYGKEVADNWRTISASVAELKGTRIPSKGAVPAGPGMPKLHQTALDNLNKLGMALHLMDKTGTNIMGAGLMSAGAGIGWLSKGLLGVKTAAIPIVAAEATGGLLTWAAVNRGRTRMYQNAASELFRYGAPSTMRLFDSYRQWLQDQRLLAGQKKPPGPPPTPPPTLPSSLPAGP
jgi:hypothetical protein